MTLRLLVASKLSSYLRTCPGYSISLLGFHFAGTCTLNPSPLYGKKSVLVFGLPKTFAATNQERRKQNPQYVFKILYWSETEMIQGYSTFLYIRTCFTVGGISGRYFGTNSGGTNEECESETAGDGGVIVFMRLLGFTHDLNRFGE